MSQQHFTQPRHTRQYSQCATPALPYRTRSVTSAMMASRLDMEAEHQAGHGQVHTKHSTLVQKKTDDSGFCSFTYPCLFARSRDLVGHRSKASARDCHARDHAVPSAATPRHIDGWHGVTHVR